MPLYSLEGGDEEKVVSGSRGLLLLAKFLIQMFNILQKNPVVQMSVVPRLVLPARLFTEPSSYLF